MDKIILLDRGYGAVVSEEDFEWLNQWEWFYSLGYAVRPIWKNNRPTSFAMHRQILNMGEEPSSIYVDHINRNRLDNRRSNLRKATPQQNILNVPAWGKSQYRGVSWNKQASKWQAKIRREGKQRHIGLFDCEKSAAKAYDEAALLVWGEDAPLNFR